jgi:hypothetical protein
MPAKIVSPYHDQVMMSLHLRESAYLGQSIAFLRMLS